MNLRQVCFVLGVVGLCSCAAFALVQAPRTAGLKQFASLAPGASRADIEHALGSPFAVAHSARELCQALPHHPHVQPPTEGNLLLFQLRFTPILVGCYVDDQDRLVRKIEIQAD